MRSTKLRAALIAAPVLVSGLISGCGQDTAGSAAASETPSASATATTPAQITTALAKLEKQHHRRLGVYLLDTGTGRTVTYHADERFGFCSTAKVFDAGVLLRRSSDTQLNQVVSYGRDDLQEHSPITEKHVDSGMSVRDLIKAALQYSDNTAANLLLERLGGPAGLQQAMRGLGDATSNIDRVEPALNDTPPGTTRDTSTPRTMGTDLRRFLLGTVLSADRRTLLATWMGGNTTGDDLIRAGVPSDWTVADKTGSGLTYGTQNDIAVAWRPHGAPVVIALMSRGFSKNAESDQALLAAATNVALAGLR